MFLILDFVAPTFITDARATQHWVNQVWFDSKMMCMQPESTHIPQNTPVQVLEQMLRNRKPLIANTGFDRGLSFSSGPSFLNWCRRFSLVCVFFFFSFCKHKASTHCTFLLYFMQTQAISVLPHALLSAVCTSNLSQTPALGIRRPYSHSAWNSSAPRKPSITLHTWADQHDFFTLPRYELYFDAIRSVSLFYSSMLLYSLTASLNQYNCCKGSCPHSPNNGHCWQFI